MDFAGWEFRQDTAGMAVCTTMPGASAGADGNARELESPRGFFAQLSCALGGTTGRLGSAGTVNHSRAMTNLHVNNLLSVGLSHHSTADEPEGTS